MLRFSIGAATMAGILALAYAFYTAKRIFEVEVADAKLEAISRHIADGAMAFLSREYRALIPFVVVVAALLAIGNAAELRWTSVAFMLGAACSALAGYFGMKVATAANSRTTLAARRGVSDALRVSFSGATAMGMCVVGLALLGIAAGLLAAISAFGGGVADLQATCLPVLVGFSFGASSIALFARVGGGIFTKAADIGADLVGKVEASIPEDDPRNPATIADNVGDNVGDVAGMGADLFESYVGCLIGCMILGAAARAPEPDMGQRLVGLPLLLASLGVLTSLVGFRFVGRGREMDPQKALSTGCFVAAALTVVLAWPLCRWVIGTHTFATPRGEAGAFQVFLSSTIGLIAGVLIGVATEYCTGMHRRPVRQIVKSCETGSATVLITGLAVGMASTGPPVVCVAAAILASHFLAGLYGIGIAALGMLTTLGIQLAVDGYGPIADNAGGLAEMSGFPPEVRRVTDRLDAVGNTTAAIGKGFAIGSAALTAVVLFTAYQQQTGAGMILLTDPKVLVGILVGGVAPYLFSSLLIGAVGRAAFAMVAEVRRQFQSIPGLLTGRGEPEYARCIDISAAAALKGMMLPGVLAGLMPVVVGFLGGIEMLAGLLVGVTVSGFALAVFMANAGGAWDNAKKMIEEGAGDSKGSEQHKAAVVGDTVGDPLKDTAGPSLNILIKLTMVVSLLLAPVLRAYWGR